MGYAPMCLRTKMAVPAMGSPASDLQQGDPTVVDSPILRLDLPLSVELGFLSQDHMYSGPPQEIFARPPT